MFRFAKRAFKYAWRCVKNYIVHRKEQILWLKDNQHNKTRMGNYFPRNAVKVGNYTYGQLNVHIFGAENEGIQIGNYCSIGPDVEFFGGGEHHPKFLSNYPFALYFAECSDYESMDRTSKGKIIIEDDVWIGAHALILSGTHIGQGAIIGAGSVVAKDIPAYAIFANGKIIGYRFSEEIISMVKKIDFSKLSKEMVVEHIDDFYTYNVEEVLDKNWLPIK